MITVHATVTTQGPLAIATGRSDATSDRPVVRDQRGHPLIPGTSLAGALRRAAQRRYGDQTANRLFGPASIDRDTQAFRSTVWVADARHLDVQLPPIQLRQHVGIDRERLAAKDGLKFDEQTWPLGLRFAFELACEESDLGYVVGLLDEISSPAGGLGSGPCRISVEDRRAYRRATTADLVAHAARRFTEPGLADARGEQIAVPQQPEPGRDGATVAISIELTARTATPLACREPRDPFTSDRDNEPYATIVRAGDGFVRRPGVPGSSLLGVLRQRAERALAGAGISGGDPFDSDGPDPDTPVGRTFGTAGDDSKGARAGAVLIEDALTTGLSWPLGEVVEPPPGWITRQRVKLDRLTHSPLGSAFFDDTLLADGTELRVRIDLAPPDREVDDRDLALVAVGLRDLASGAVGVGGSSRSGYGTLEFVRGRLTEYRRDKGHLVTTDHELQPADGNTGWPAELAARIEVAWKELTDG